jgi:hypothetical protein
MTSRLGKPEPDLVEQETMELSADEGRNSRCHEGARFRGYRVLNEGPRGIHLPKCGIRALAQDSDGTFHW